MNSEGFFLIQKAKKPKWDDFPDTIFNIIFNNKRSWNSLNLNTRLIFLSDLKSELFIYNKIPLWSKVHLRNYPKLLRKKSFPKATNIHIFLTQSISKIGITEV
jgi:hypothetical protein